jgi:hypothetical protein
MKAMQPGKIASMLIPGIPGGMLTGMKLGEAVGAAIGIPGGPIAMAAFAVGLGLLGAITGGLIGLATYSIVTRNSEIEEATKEIANEQTEKDAKKLSSIISIMKHLKKKSIQDKNYNATILNTGNKTTGGIAYELLHDIGENAVLNKTQRKLAYAISKTKLVQKEFSTSPNKHQENIVSYKVDLAKAKMKHSQELQSSGNIHRLKRWLLSLFSNDVSKPKYYASEASDVMFFQAGKAVDLTAAQQNIATMKGRKELVKNLLSLEQTQLDEIDSQVAKLKM